MPPDTATNTVSTLSAIASIAAAIPLPPSQAVAAIAQGAALLAPKLIAAWEATFTEHGLPLADWLAGFGDDLSYDDFKAQVASQNATNAVAATSDQAARKPVTAPQLLAIALAFAQGTPLPPGLTAGETDAIKKILA